MADITKIAFNLKDVQIGAWGPTTVYWDILECNSGGVPITSLASGNFSADVLDPISTWVWHEIVVSVAVSSGTKYCVAVGAYPTAGDPIRSLVRWSNPSTEEGTFYGTAFRTNGVWSFAGDVTPNPTALKVWVDSVLAARLDTGTLSNTLNAYADSPPRLFGAVMSFSFPPDVQDNPFPSDGADGVAPGYPIVLTWDDPGEGEDNAATSWKVYFGNDLTGPEFQETVDEKQWAIPENFTGLVDYLAAGATYQWRIDAVNDDGTTTGDQWEFDTSLIVGLGKARDPVPADTATDQSVNLASLSFSDGEGASDYDVYFGTPGNLSLLGNVEYADQAISIAYQSLLANTTYNWRVDANNSLGTVTGDTWAFTTTSDFNPPDPTSGGLGPNGENTAFITIRKLIAAAKNAFYYESS